MTCSATIKLECDRSLDLSTSGLCISLYVCMYVRVDVMPVPVCSHLSYWRETTGEECSNGTCSLHVQEVLLSHLFTDTSLEEAL